MPALELFKHFMLFLFSHALFDFPLQSDPIAKFKNRHKQAGNLTGVAWYYWMLAHSLCHGLGVYAVSTSTVLGLLETGFHFLIDVLKCEGYTNIDVDQALHVICKILWIALLALYGPLP